MSGSEPVDVSRGCRPTRLAQVKAGAALCDAARVRGEIERLLWVVCLVTPGAEAAVINRLALRGVLAWCPTATVYRRANRAARGKRLRVFPAAPGYVAVGLDPRFPRWVSVLACDGVRGFLGPDGRPVVLSVAAVEALLGVSWVAPDAAKHMGSGWEFDVGDRVRVVDGPFEGAETAVLGIHGAEARVVLTVLGAAREVRVQLGVLAKAA